MTFPPEAITYDGSGYGLMSYSGLVFINYYSATVSDILRGQIIYAETDLEARYTNATTVNVHLDFQPLGSKVVAQNSFNTVTVSYANFVAALRAHATTPDDLLAVNGLPTTDPSHGTGFTIPTAQARILGLAPQTNAVDIVVVINSDLAPSFGFDARGALAHELTEGVFGRVASLGFEGGAWAPLDLFRFTAAGVRDYTGGSDGVATYFGLDANHISNLPFHNAISANGVDDGKDLGDWDVGGDPFGFGDLRTFNPPSATDFQVLNILGWAPYGYPGSEYTPAPDDFASRLSNPSAPFGQLAVGGTTTGALQTAGDRDWFATQLQGSATYVVTETGRAGGGGNLADAFLRVRDAQGAVLYSNDDIVGGSNPDSQIQFVSPAGGTFYVEAGGFVDGYAGSYSLSLTQLAPALPAPIVAAFVALTRADPSNAINASSTTSLAQGLAGGILTQSQAVGQLVRNVAGTTSVATLAYEFFTGKIPSAGGIDFLVSPTGPNPNHINSAYYQSFTLENRYINFAVNLGKAGEGNAAFTAAYGAKNLFDATSAAYATIFGSTPSDAKLHALLDPSFVLNGVTMTRADYFAYYGQDGANGIGTKAAMVGWLLAEAVKADVGMYAKSNDAFLTDLADGAVFAVDIVGAYGKPEYVFSG